MRRQNAKLWAPAMGAYCLVVLLTPLLRPPLYASMVQGMPSARITADAKGDPETLGSAPGETALRQFMVLDAKKSHLVNTFTNKPVFIAGDTAWSLIAQPSNEDVDTYLADRASRGFNAIIVNLIEHQYADHAPKDFYGEAPFSGPSFLTPNEPYFAHADQVIRQAAAKGIVVFLFPVFLGYGSGACNEKNEGWGTDMENASDAVMTAWGVYVGNRYKSFPNIVYVIGDDADPRTCTPSLVGKLNDVAEGIKSVDSVHLMTAVNAGQQSALDVWSGYRWLDINVMYNSSNPGKLNSEYTRADFLPFFMDEDEYENEHQTTPRRLRTRQYWSVLSGAYLGSFFGNNPIDCFAETNPSSAVLCHNMKAWKSELGSAGSVGQSWFGKLFRSREHWLLVPDIDHTVVTAGYGSGSKLTTTARTSDGQTIIAYTPIGNRTTLSVDMSKITSASKRAKCWWFNPRSGSATRIGNFPNFGRRKFTPPNSNDWVLVIDAADANLPRPGSNDL